MSPAPKPLHQADAIVRATFESALDGIVVLDALGRQVAFNARFVDLWRFPPDMLARRDTAEMRRHAASQLRDPSGFLANVPEASRVDRAMVIDEVEHVDGRIFERHVAPLGDAGFPGALVVRWRDVTEVRRAQRTQLRNAAQMELAMTAAGLVFWEIEVASGAMSAADPGWVERVLGWSPAELPPRTVAWDALVHPDDVAPREAAWQGHLAGGVPAYEAEFRIRHRDGQWRWLMARGRAIDRDAAGLATRVVGIFMDITARKHAEEQLQRQAYTDALTGLLARRRLLELAAIELERSRRHGLPIALAMVDLDRFKSVNDRLGHAAGDAVLERFAATAQSLLRGSDLLGRIGGEEFAIVLPLTDAEGAAALAARLRDAVHDQPAAWHGSTIAYTVSIGVAARHPAPDASAPVLDDLLAAADAALYQAKREGRDSVRVDAAGDGPAPSAISPPKA